MRKENHGTHVIKFQKLSTGEMWSTVGYVTSEFKNQQRLAGNKCIVVQGGRLLVNRPSFQGGQSILHLQRQVSKNNANIPQSRTEADFCNQRWLPSTEHIN